MKLLIVSVIALVAATTLGLVFLDDPGLMVLSYGQNSWELPLVLAVLLIFAAFAILYLLFNFLFGLFRAPKKVKQWNQQRQNKNAQTDTLRGYARLIEGNWAQGEKDLLKRLGHCNTPMLNYLGAAYAAQQQKNYDKRDEYLAEAEKTDPANRMAIDITRARMLLQASEFEQVTALLADMHHHAPANKTILRLMADNYQQTGDWQAVSALLPKLSKAKALPKDQLSALDISVREANLHVAVPDANNLSTLAQYKKLPAKRKKDAQMAMLYAQKLITEGELNDAEVVVRKAIKQQWNTDLAALYGKTRMKDLRKQIAFATAWLAEHEDDANVNLCLARLNQAHGLADKARLYFNKSIALGAGDEAFYELGQLYEAEGNPKTALSYYKQGMQASIGERSVVGSATATPALEMNETSSTRDPALVIVGGNLATDAAASPVPTSVIEHKA